MRKNLLCFVLRIAVLSLVISGGFQSARAHDWPTNLAISSHITNCLGVEACPLTSSEPASITPMKFAVAMPNSSFFMATAYSQLAYQSVSRSSLAGKFTNGIDALAGFWAHLETADSEPELFAALPDDGVPPAPAARSKAEELASRSNAKRQFDEDYMPYDFCVRDWRFGQYSYRSLSRIAHLDMSAVDTTDELQPEIATVAEAAPPSETAIALGNALRQLDEAKCGIDSQLSDLRAVRDASSAVTSSYLNANAKVAGLAERFAEHLFTASPQPYITTPQFVIYEVDGQQYLLPAGEPQVVQVVEQPAGSEATILASADYLRSKVLGLAGRQLETVGTQLLELSSIVNSLAQPQVASRPQSEIR